MEMEPTKIRFEYEGGRAMPAEVAEILQLDVNAGLSEDEDDDSYDEGQELADLVVASVKSSRRPQAAQAALQRRTAAAAAASTKNKPPPFVQKILRKLFGTRRSRQFMAVIFLAFLILFLIIPSSSSSSTDSASASLLNKHSKGVPESARLKCPSRVKTNTDAIRHNATLDISSTSDPKQFQAWMKTFRDREMDYWGHTYTQVKQSMSEWKRKHFAPFLSRHNNASATIYDASLGVGLNLFLTLEILKENYDLTNIVVCGNDIQSENVQTAHSVMNHLLHSVKGLYGRFCKADSTLLHEFIPDNTFDVVFASHIPPLVNPLSYRYNVLNKEADLDRKYTALCSAADKKRNQDKLQLLQERQEAWYRKWVLEMLQIAKPGSPVVVEQVSPPLCEAQFDFGGVSQEFWKKDSKIAAMIEPNSIEFEQSSLITKRYHVFMLKKKDSKKNKGK